ncbi:Nitric oxide synthase [Papilio xuthus]|uniref:Nitric oxide synthase n=1 Tax=Papilio xuthus TaxID=66420 RepID=A0A194QE22_PAPXU|nr:Nitric oxide synthase [Papilio xuthus]
MDHLNGQYNPPTCPFRSDRVDIQRNGKTNLRIKVPMPLKLKNHLVSEENFDILHSRIDEVSNFCFVESQSSHLVLRKDRVSSVGTMPMSGPR